MSGITTHVLDVSIGRPASGISVTLERQTNGDDWEKIGFQTTDADGRARALVPENEELMAGVHRLTFEIASYFSSRSVDAFYREVSIAFVVDKASQHYHVPLLLSPFGYSTYRGT